MSRVFFRPKKSKYRGEEDRFLGIFKYRHGIDFYQQANNIHGKEIKISREMPDLDSEGRTIYFTPTSRISRADRRRMRLEEEAKERVADVSPMGVSDRVLLAAMITIVVVMGIWLIVQNAQLNTSVKHVAELERKIELAENNIVALENRYEQTAASIDIGYKAVDLGMVSSKSLTTISLYVPSDAENGPPVTTNGLTTTQFAAIGGK